MGVNIIYYSYNLNLCVYLYIKSQEKKNLIYLFLLFYSKKEFINILKLKNIKK